jgi:hypothetical protein
MADESDKLRHDLVSGFLAYTEALGKFLSEGVDRVGLIREIMRRIESSRKLTSYEMGY